jgi:hypothetical protein
MKYFQVKVQFTTDEGKKIKLQYLVDAMSVTEAEARTIKYLTDVGEINFEVKAAVDSPIVEVILPGNESHQSEEEESNQ